MNKLPDTQEIPDTKPKIANAPVRWDVEDIGDDKRATFKRKLTIGIALLAAVAGVLFVSKKFSNSGPAQQRQPEMTIVAIQAPPPPPPPPPKPTPPPELTPPKQEMIKEDAPDDKQEKPKDETPPAPQITTGIKGPGGDSSMGTAGNGSVFGGSGKRGGSKFGWYAGPVQSRIAEALRTNKGTRGVKIESLPVRIWVDSNGAISRVELRGSTGQSGQDEAIRQALLGLRLSEPPPSDMPMPINLRLSARAGFTAQR